MSATFGVSQVLAPETSAFLASFGQDYMRTGAMLGSVYFGLTSLMYVYFFMWIKDDPKLGKKIQPKRPHTFRIFVQECLWSCSTIIVGSFFVTILLRQYAAGATTLYWNISDWGVAYYIFSTSMMWLFNDTYMYWMHRWMHIRAWWGGLKYHRIHHLFTAPTPFSMMAFHPVEAFFQFVVLLAAVWFPLHLPTLMFVMGLLFFISMMEHCGYEIPTFERTFESFLATPVHHDIHHSKIRCNYGVYMPLWDWLCDTRVHTVN
eukprot:GFYU01007568.1.p2 GENE.GFYU01007568.1~~GFYU01007568.1.p2  ORF type:complete len:261 (+),score=66.87 GFYU01007568.1:195-977(+)